MRAKLGFSGFVFPKDRVLAETISLLAIVALCTSCLDATGAAGGWLTATVQRSVDAAETSTVYEGTGDFNVGKDPAAGVSVAFSLNSRGTGESLGQSLMLHRPGNGRPSSGQYALAPLETKDGQMEGFTAFYFRTANGRAESFTAVSGEVEITESSSDRVTGTFSFTAVVYCSVAVEGPAPDDWCVEPNTITPGAPQVEITGSFAAVQLKLGPQVPSVP